jgi:hypothetical protein
MVVTLQYVDQVSPPDVIKRPMGKVIGSKALPTAILDIFLAMLTTTRIMFPEERSKVNLAFTSKKKTSAVRKISENGGEV